MKVSIVMIFVVVLNVYFYSQSGNIAQLVFAVIAGQYGAAMYIVEKLQKAT